MTAAKLGQAVGVSESTVVRFANSLGYSGYPELQRELQEMLRARLTGTQRMELTGQLPNSKLFEKVLKTDSDNIRLTLNEIDTQAFEDAVQTIIMGVRSAHTIAYILGYYLDFILDNVRTVTDASSDNIEQLIHIGQGDVFIGISFPRYSKRTVDAMCYAKARGAKCIGIIFPYKNGRSLQYGLLRGFPRCALKRGKCSFSGNKSGKEGRAFGQSI